jgi:hypothetical protein
VLITTVLPGQIGVHQLGRRIAKIESGCRITANHGAHRDGILNFARQRDCRRDPFHRVDGTGPLSQRYRSRGERAQNVDDDDRILSARLILQTIQENAGKAHGEWAR